MRKLIVVCSLCLFSLACAAQDHPGSVDFSRFGDFDDSQISVDLTLGGWLLGFAKLAASQSDDPELAVLSKVSSVRVRVFEVTDVARSRLTATTVAQQLLGEGWERLAKVNDKGSLVHVLVKGDADTLAGITVIAMDHAHEGVLINIAGRLDPQDIARLLDDEDLLHVDLDVDWDA